MILIDYKGHMVSTHSLGELHQFAYWHLGLRNRRRYHGLRRGHPHYDVPHLRILALGSGAEEVSTRTLVKRMVRR